MTKNKKAPTVEEAYALLEASVEELARDHGFNHAKLIATLATGLHTLGNAVRLEREVRALFKRIAPAASAPYLEALDRLCLDYLASRKFAADLAAATTIPHPGDNEPCAP